MYISSMSNNRIKTIRGLRQRKERQASGLCFIEGLHLCRAASDNGAIIETIVSCPERISRAPVWTWIEEQRSRCVPVLEVSAAVFDSLVEKETDQGIGAVVRQHWYSPSDLVPLTTGCYVALEAVQYPGNLGTIVRTADAVGAAGVLLLDNTTDPYDPQAVRASKGAVFTKRLVRMTSDTFATWKRENDLTVVAATPDSPFDYRFVRYELPLVLLLGQERNGLSPGLRRLCDTSVCIPMQGKCDSLNLAIAAGVLLYAILGSQMPSTVP